MLSRFDTMCTCRPMVLPEVSAPARGCPRTRINTCSPFRPLSPKCCSPPLLPFPAHLSSGRGHAPRNPPFPPPTPSPLPIPAPSPGYLYAYPPPPSPNTPLPRPATCWLIRPAPSPLPLLFIPPETLTVNGMTCLLTAESCKQNVSALDGML